jgi:hypothetical protein
MRQRVAVAARAASTGTTRGSGVPACGAPGARAAAAGAARTGASPGRNARQDLLE